MSKSAYRWANAQVLSTLRIQEILQKDPKYSDDDELIGLFSMKGKRNGSLVRYKYQGIQHPGVDFVLYVNLGDDYVLSPGRVRGVDNGNIFQCLCWEEVEIVCMTNDR